jgi:DNA-binding NarL/FixJ family response regulator
MISVLLIDGDVAGFEGIAAALSTTEGIEAFRCSSAEEAAEIAARSNVHVIILRHHLGGSNLRAAISHLRQCGVTAGVLVVTGWIGDSERIQLRQMGIAGVFSVRGHLDDLVREIHRVAAGGTWTEEVLQPAGRTEVDLSQQQQRVLALVCDGLSNKGVAAAMSVSESYVKAVLQRVFLKMGVRSRGNLIRLVMQSSGALKRVT